jgi:cell division protein FtsI/penicillin-binding protein 2
MATRIKLLSILFLVSFIALTARLFYWQIVKGGSLSQEARYQYRVGEVIAAPRGDILAPDGTYWVLGGEAWQVYINPQKITASPQSVAQKLYSLLEEEDSTRLTQLISKSDLQWVSLKEKVSPEVKKNIEAMGIPGIGFEPQEARVYPEASVAAQILGFVGKDDDGKDTGYFGLEGYYNLSLAGKEGYIGGEKDALGSPILIGGKRSSQAIPGVDLETSLDKRIQLVVSSKLKEGIERYGAKSGTVIVMDPKSGAILGMESYPSYNPAGYREYTDSLFKNPAVSDTFEPGSVFKVLVMASALDAKVVDPDTICDVCDGPVRVDKYTIETWDGEYRPDSTMTDVIVHSDNVGMTFVGQKLGADTLFDYLERFGIGKPTGVDLQGEASPGLRKKGTWNEVDLATASFGQGVAVTPLQMIRAVSAIANDGIIVTPRVVRSTQAPQTARVISTEAADKITAMMAEAAKGGESKWTNLRGFKIAGKTGTAQIPIAGHYDAEKTNATFVGFVPYDKPKFAMLVTLSEPQTSPWASETAAPLWYSIAKDLFPYLGIHPE